jgi:hypothetical protein
MLSELFTTQRLVAHILVSAKRWRMNDECTAGFPLLRFQSKETYRLRTVDDESRFQRLVSHPRRKDQDDFPTTILRLTNSLHDMDTHPDVDQSIHSWSHIQR